MAKAEEKVSYKELSLDDLRVQLADCSDKIFKLRFKHSVAPVKNPIEIRTLKRARARILTFMRQKELASATVKSVPAAKAAPAVKVAAAGKSSAAKKKK